jgi:hypothetical protein
MKLVYDEVNSDSTELELTKDDLKSDQVEVFEKIKLCWAAIRNARGRTG